jgi:phenylacetate-CoA ligase
LLALYRSSNMFVHVSLTEGVPQVLIEAFATGLPVVATDVGGVAAAVGRGEAALLVPPGELAPLVTAIERLLEDPVERDRLAEAGLARARALTLEHEGARVASFVAAGRVPPGPP